MNNPAVCAAVEAAIREKALTTSLEDLGMSDSEGYDE